MKSKFVTIALLCATLPLTGCTTNSEFLTYQEIQNVANNLPCDVPLEIVNESPQCIEHEFEGQNWFISWNENDETWVERRLCPIGMDTVYLVGPNWFVDTPTQYNLIGYNRLDEIKDLLGGEILPYNEICAKS